MLWIPSLIRGMHESAKLEVHAIRLLVIDGSMFVHEDIYVTYIR